MDNLPSGRVNSIIWIQHMDADEAYGEKILMGRAQECYEQY